MTVVSVSPALASAVRIRQNSSRSVNVEQDLDITTVADGYVLTPQARQALQQIVAGAENGAQRRAWTLTGPYGSGKSYFGLFLMNLVCSRLVGHETASRQLALVDPVLLEQTRRVTRALITNGLLPVPITGYRAPLQTCIAHGLRHALESLRANTAVQALLDDQAAWAVEIDSRSLVRVLEKVLSLLAEGTLGFSGLLIVLDEMGKPLEYAAAHPDVSDLYLLQQIAELANRSQAAPLVFVGILHQSFDRYAGHLESFVQREWDKVQGRFQDIAFHEPPNQQIRLIAQAFEPLGEDIDAAIGRDVERHAQAALDAGWGPATVRPADFVAFCRQAYPLHPTVLAVLPYLFRRLAQNERSLFAYLTSSEPKGLQEYLAGHAIGDFVQLPDLFDYLVANFQSRLYTSGRSRPVTEAIERLQSSGELNADASDLVKTVALLNWLADLGPFRATEIAILSALQNASRSGASIKRTLDLLQRRSLIVFRRYSQSYVIWQGSDVDIDERTQDARRRLVAQFSVADAVQAHLPPQPVVARRHSYETGTVRYFELRYVDALIRDRVSLAPPPGASGLVLLCLSASEADERMFVAWAQDARFSASPGVVVGVAQRTTRLADLLAELRALHWVRANTPELRDDPVARRELRARIADLETLVRNELDHSLRMQGSIAGGCRWFRDGQEVERAAVRSLSHLLSSVCDDLYPASPRIRNEILNRRALSSQGAAARRNLLEGMLQRSEFAHLGIEGFPPERSMHDSLLRTGGLHRHTESGAWQLAPPPAADPLNLRPVWGAIAGYVFAPPPEPRAVAALFEQLGAAPYGVTQGVLPVLLCAFMLVHQDEATLYREGSLLVEPGIADWEMLLRRPELFAVAGCRVAGPRAAVIERMARSLRTAPAAVPVVRELVRRLKSLPEFAWRTQRLAPQALAVRRAVEQARSPENLLFHELPAALNMPPFGETEVTEGQSEEFFARLNGALEELAQCTTRAIRQARDTLLAACALPATDGGWERFTTLAGSMTAYVTQPTLLPLLRRAADSGPVQTVLESTLAYVANRPPRSWTDGDVDRFGAQARLLGASFQAERNGHFPGAGLTQAEAARSQQIAREVRNYLDERFGAEPHVLHAALQAIVAELCADDTDHA